VIKKLEAAIPPGFRVKLTTPRFLWISLSCLSGVNNNSPGGVVSAQIEEGGDVGVSSADRPDCIHANWE
jgi:hypothetical protein